MTLAIQTSYKPIVSSGNFSNLTSNPRVNNSQVSFTGGRLKQYALSVGHYIEGTKYGNRLMQTKCVKFIRSNPIKAGEYLNFACGALAMTAAEGLDIISSHCPQLIHLIQHQIPFDPNVVAPALYISTISSFVQALGCRFGKQVVKNINKIKIFFNKN